MNITELILTKWHWFGLAAILATLEVILGTSFILLWLAISATTVAIILFAMPTITWQYQLLLFALGATACLVFWHWQLKTKKTTSNQSTLNRRNEQYINRIFTLTEPIVNGRGKIQVDDSFWLIAGNDLPVGTKVKVTNVDGVILQVEELINY